MSERILNAYLDGTYIGVFSLSTGGNISFVYDAHTSSLTS